MTIKTEDPDKAQWATFIAGRVEKTAHKVKPRRTQVDFELARIRVTKRLLNRALKSVEVIEKDLLRMRKEDRS